MDQPETEVGEPRIEVVRLGGRRLVDKREARAQSRAFSASCARSSVTSMPGWRKVASSSRDRERCWTATDLSVETLWRSVVAASIAWT